MIDPSIASAVPEAAIRHKNAGGKYFSKADYSSALVSYEAALACLEPILVWPEHEQFALILHSNAALCLIKSNLHEHAAKECAKARLLPVFQVDTSDTVRQKVLARHIEALVGMVSTASSDDDKKTNNTKGSALQEKIWSLLDEARQRGYLAPGTAIETRRTFLRLGARASSMDGENSGLLDAWIDRLVQTGVVAATQAQVVKQQQQQTNGDSAKDNEASKEQKVLDLLDSILPQPTLAMVELCKLIIAIIRLGDPAGVSQFRMSFRNSNLYVSALDDDGTGHLMWAISFGLQMSEYGPGPVSVFIELLTVLVDEFGVSVDQRAPRESDGSRNPLQYVAKYGSPVAVRAMIERGSNVNLRDEEGWTALAAVCMNDVKGPHEGGPPTSDRVETAKLLLDAGADVDPQTQTGYTPLLTNCCAPCPPLIELLLARGANRHHRNQLGFSCISFLEPIADKYPSIVKECKSLLTSNSDTIMREDAKTVKFHHDLLSNVLIPASNSAIDSNQSLFIVAEGMRERAHQEMTVLSALFEYLGMDANLLRDHFSETSQNWLETCHTKLHAIIPSAYVKVYYDGLPKGEDITCMISQSKDAMTAGGFANADGVRRFNQEAAVRSLFTNFRERGSICDLNMEDFVNTVIDPIQHCVGFAVPTEAVLGRIAQYGPVVEVGAGTGYWSAVLQARKVDVIAYDANPPTEDHTGSRFFNFTYTDVLKGDARSMFEQESGTNLAKRTLLIVWPNNPDKEDNPHLNTNSFLPPTWDADCLGCYVRAGGSTVIYVGEREENIKVIPGGKPDCGISSSRRFQNMLKEYFDMAEEHTLPSWHPYEDDLTIWKRKTKLNKN